MVTNHPMHWPIPREARQHSAVPPDSKPHWHTTTERNRQRSVCPRCETRRFWHYYSLGSRIQVLHVGHCSTQGVNPLTRPCISLTNQISAKVGPARKTQKRISGCQSPQRGANTYSQERQQRRHGVESCL